MLSRVFRLPFASNGARQRRSAVLLMRALAVQPVTELGGFRANRGFKETLPGASVSCFARPSDRAWLGRAVGRSHDRLRDGAPSAHRGPRYGEPGYVKSPKDGDAGHRSRRCTVRHGEIVCRASPFCDPVRRISFESHGLLMIR
jgi:hypothetical protein